MPDLTPATKWPKVLLADDHAVVAAALQSLLADHCEVVGIVADGRALIDKARELKPDLIVADIAMPLLNGMDAAEQLKHSMPHVRFVFLTMMDDPKLAAAALRMAPVGYVLKHSAASELVTAIDSVLHGRSYVTPRIKSGVAAVGQEPTKKNSAELTPRQRGAAITRQGPRDERHR